MTVAWLRYPSLAQDFANQIAEQFTQVFYSKGGDELGLPIPMRVLAADSQVWGQGNRFILASAWALRHRQPLPLGLSLPIFSRDGWLYQPLTDTILVGWLTQLLQVSPQLNLLDPFGQIAPPAWLPVVEPQLKFGLQYIHARCSSLVRLAQREGFLTFVELAWLTPDQRLILSTPAEENLLLLLLRLPLVLSGTSDLRVPPKTDLKTDLDGAYPLAWPPNQKTFTAYLQAWSWGFDQFYRDCQIWGEVKKQQPQLAQARFGLLMIIQTLMRFLLVELLEEEAPLTL